MAAEIFDKGKARTELVVVLHGLRRTPQDMQGIIDAVRDGRADADILAVPLAFGGPSGLFAMRPAERIAVDVAQRIEAAIAARRADKEAPSEYERFILVGYSFGGVIARKVAIIANGEQGAPFEPLLEDFRLGREWGAKIERIVLLAGMSRGWSPEAARNWLTATMWTVGSWASEILALLLFELLRPTISGIRQGAPFIIQTRLQWLALMSCGAAPRIPVVQLLGATDDLVAPDDSVDFACDANGERTTPFVLIEVPFTGHEDAHEMKRPSPDERKKIEEGIRQDNLADVCKEHALTLQARSLVLSRAVSQSLAQLADIAVDPQHMSDTPALQPDPDATHFVFVIHGIRDHGFWTQKIARVIKEEVEKENKGKPPDAQQRFYSFTGSYGYFAMVPFVLPWVRRWKVEWLMDRYVEARARYPNADISYVGHSNGTYLLARALHDYPAASFARVVLAGSVIRRDYDWKSLLSSKPQRVREVLNYVATWDWVVAIFSNAFQPLRVVFDLGSAGHDGFDQFKTERIAGLYESHYVEGAHSAALTETQWSEIARFIVKGGRAPDRPPIDFRPHRRRWAIAAGWMSSLILAALVVLVVGLGVELVKSALSVEGMWVWRASVVSVCFLYWWAVYLFTTRF